MTLDSACWCRRVAVIAFFLRYLQTRTLKIFVVYRFAFGILILLLMFLHRVTAR